MEPVAEPVSVGTEHENSSTLSDQHSSPPFEPKHKTQLHDRSLHPSWSSNQDDNFSIYRRFGFLRARAILYREQETRFLEQVLQELEKMEDTRTDLLTALVGALNRSNDLLIYSPYDKNNCPKIYASVRNTFHEPRKFRSSQPELDTSVLNNILRIGKASWDRYTTDVQRDRLMKYMLGGDIGGERHAGCFISVYPDRHFGGNMYGKRVAGKKLALLHTLAILAGSCAGMLFSGASFPGGMRTVTGVVSTSAAVANVPLHMRSDYNRLRWSVLAFCVIFYGSFLTFLWLSLKGIRRPAYLFFTFLSGAGFIGSALVADKVEDTVDAILTFSPLVATLSAGLLYMPFRYGFGIGANSVEDVEMQSQDNN